MVISCRFSGTRQTESGHRRRAGHLEIEPGCDRFAQPPDVAVLDVPAVLAQVHGDPVGAGAFGELRQRDRIGFDGPAAGSVGRAVAGLTQRRAMIDVYAEENHAGAADYKLEWR